MKTYFRSHPFSNSFQYTVKNEIYIDISESEDLFKSYAIVVSLSCYSTFVLQLANQSIVLDFFGYPFQRLLHVLNIVQRYAKSFGNVKLVDGIKVAFQLQLLQLPLRIEDSEVAHDLDEKVNYDIIFTDVWPHQPLPELDELVDDGSRVQGGCAGLGVNIVHRHRVNVDTSRDYF